MTTLRTFLSILSLFCWVAVKAQVAVVLPKSLWKIKEDNKTGKLTVYSEEGKLLLNNIDSIKPLKGHMFIVTKNHLKGIYDTQGKELIPIKYNKIERFGDSWSFFWKVYLNGLQGLYTYEGKEVLSAEYENISSIDRGYGKAANFIVKEKGQYGMFNAEGERLIKSEYDDVKFDNGHYYFQKGEKKDYLKRDKQTLLKGISIKGQITSPQYESMDSYYNISSGNKDYLVVKQNSHYGVINFSNEVLIPLKYKSFSKIYIRDHIALEDEKGYILCSLKDNSIFQSLHFNDIRETSGPYAVIEKEGKEALLNKLTLDLLFPFQYEEIVIVDEDSLFSVRLNDKYGIVDKNDKTIIPCMYDEWLYKVGGDKFVVKKDNQYGIINSKNQLVFGMIPHPIIAYSDYFQVIDISRNNPEYDWNFKEIKRE